jgi:hypothetical protein
MKKETIILGLNVLTPLYQKQVRLQSKKNFSSYEQKPGLQIRRSDFRRVGGCRGQGQSLQGIEKAVGEQNFKAIGACLQRDSLRQESLANQFSVRSRRTSREAFWQFCRLDRALY